MCLISAEAGKLHNAKGTWLVVFLGQVQRKPRSWFILASSLLPTAQLSAGKNQMWSNCEVLMFLPQFLFVPVTPNCGTHVHLAIPPSKAQLSISEFSSCVCSENPLPAWWRAVAGLVGIPLLLASADPLWHVPFLFHPFQVTLFTHVSGSWLLTSLLDK